MEEDMTPPLEASNECQSIVKTKRSGSPLKTIRSDKPNSPLKTVKSGRTVKS